MTWWRDGVVYQIYPRSFSDSNNDGVGDLQGLIRNLDYLNDGTPASLGIDAIWLSPIFPSPMADFGYDIADYCDIDPLFGSLADFDQLLAEAHRRGIRIILDLVANHTSDQHPWFLESCQPGSAKSDWYIWHEGPTLPNNWLGCLGGKAWTWHLGRQAWYFHSFLPQQPDLNWRNPEVVDAVRAIMDFWLARGVDGFRLDVVNLYYKDPLLRSNPVHYLRIARPYDRQHHLYDRNQPEMHATLRQMRQWVDAWPERMMVGEVFLAPDDNHQLPASYCGNNDELHLAFNFELMRCRFRASHFRTVLQRWQQAVGVENWPNQTLGNHDFPRHAKRFGRGRYGPQRLRLLAMMLLTLRGTPFLYYGEEIGMPEQRVPRHRIQDPVGRHYWPIYAGRDSCRRPMMWSPDIRRFSPAAAWLPNEPVAGISVEEQDNDPDSLLNWYRQLIWLRRQQTALHQGQQQILDSHPDLLVYQRQSDRQTLVIVLNFSTRSRRWPLPGQEITPLLCSTDQPRLESGELILAPLQGVLLVCS